MPTDPKKRQKKLAKKAAKRKEKKHALVKQQSLGMGQRLEKATAAPILDTWRMAELFQQGMGHVMFSRHLPDGTVAFALFLVDIWCLGVKDAMSNIISRYEYDSRFSSYHLPYKTTDMEPAAARKLVEGAVEYARELGFPPHPDYQRARLIFGDIDPNQSQEEFTYGMDGKPHFMSGPYDTPQRCRHIINTLERTCGRGNYHFTIGVPDALPEGVSDEIDEYDASDEYDELEWIEDEEDEDNPGP
jgi:hypothetical protein